MSQENVEIVRRLYEAWNRGDYRAALESIDREIEVNTVPGQTLDATYRGHTGLAELLESFWGAFENQRIEAEEYTPARDKVVVRVHYHARGQASGVEVNAQRWQVWTLRDGKAVRWQIFRTREEALEAAGLRE